MSSNFKKKFTSDTYQCKILLKTAYINSTLSSSLNPTEILLSDNNLQITGYNFARMDHPSNTKHGGECLYYKCSLPLKVIVK